MYLIKTKARVQVNEIDSRKKTPRGVPQGHVLSQTLFLVFINDMIRDLSRKAHGAIYINAQVVWCSGEHLITATGA